MEIEKIVAIAAGIIAVLAAVIGTLWKKHTESLEKRIASLELENQTLSRLWKDEVVAHSHDAKLFLDTLEKSQSQSFPIGKTIKR